MTDELEEGSDWNEEADDDPAIPPPVGGTNVEGTEEFNVEDFDVDFDDDFEEEEDDFDYGEDSFEDDFEDDEGVDENFELK